MIPIDDSLPTRKRPWVNLSIIFVTTLVFLFELGLGEKVDLLILHWGATPSLISGAIARDPRVPAEVIWTLLTSVFLHAGWMHLLGNMLFLWVFGDNVEERLGHVGYMLFYLVCGAGAGLAQVYVGPSSTVPLVGASGAIAGVLGAYLVLWPRARVTVLFPFLFLLLPLEVPIVLMLGVWFISQLGNGLAAITFASSATGGVGWWAHVGGFVLGILLTPILPKAPSTGPAYGVDAASSGREARSYGCPVRVANFLGNAIQLLILGRVIFRLLGLAPEGLWGSVVALVYALSWPLVRPFSGILPAIPIDGGVLDLSSVLALVVYHLVLSVIIWAAARSLRRRVV